MRPKGSAEALEMRRMIAVRMLQAGRGVREVSRLVGVSPASVSRWKKVLQEQGVEALRAKPHPGRPPRLTADQKQRLAEILRRGARAAGFPTDLWTLRRVAQVIQREFEVQYHPGRVWYLLRGMGWSPQKPQRRARERDEEAIRTWRTQKWEEVKKKSRENGWPILFIDESGYRLQPLVRRTWAPKGETPVHYSWDRHDRLSVIAGICFFPCAASASSVLSNSSTEHTFRCRDRLPGPGASACEEEIHPGFGSVQRPSESDSASPRATSGLDRSSLVACLCAGAEPGRNGLES
jgi:transposase